MMIVTGGAGFIGSNIIKALNSKGFNDILVVDNLKCGTKFLNLVNLNIADYIDKEDFYIQIKNDKDFGKITACFHEGACSSTIQWNGKYIMNNNYQYSKELLHFCIKNRISFLYASSAAVYGDCDTSSFVESRECEKPINIYGYSKFLFDEYVRRILKKASSQIVGLRYFNVYGPGENHKGNMKSIALHLRNQIKKGKTLKLFEGSKNFKRDFIHIDDVVDVNLWFLENGISGIFNLGTGYAESFQSLANIIIDFYKKGYIEYIPFPENMQGYYQTFTQANLARLRAVGYNKPFKTLNKGIVEYLNWLNLNQA